MPTTTVSSTLDKSSSSSNEIHSNVIASRIVSDESMTNNNNNSGGDSNNNSDMMLESIISSHPNWRYPQHPDPLVLKPFTMNRKRRHTCTGSDEQLLPDVRFAVMGGLGYKTLRARASYLSWGRCVHRERIRYYSRESLGETPPPRMVRIMNTHDDMPYQLLPLRGHECNTTSKWLFITDTDTYVNVHHLHQVIEEYNKKYTPTAQPVVIGNLVRYYPSTHKYITLAGGILMSRSAVQHGLCTSTRIELEKCSNEVTNFPDRFVECLEDAIGAHVLKLVDDKRFNVYPQVLPRVPVNISDDVSHGLLMHRSTVNTYVSVGHLWPPNMLRLGQPQNLDDVKRVLGGGFFHPLTLDDVYIMTITGATMEKRAEVIRDTWFKWSPTSAHFFSEVENKDLNTIVVEAPGGHADWRKVQRIFEWVYKNEFRSASNTKSLKHKWYYMTDDDTYARIPRLVEFLSHYDHRVPLYMGRCHYKHELADLVQGGSGVIFSAAAFEKLQDMFMGNCPGGNNGDMWIGKCTAELGMLCTDESVFHDRAPAELVGDRARIDHTIAFHMKTDTMLQLYEHDIGSRPCEHFPC